MKRYAPGVYQIINDEGGERNYTLDNTVCTLEGTTNGVIVVRLSLITNNDIKTYRIGDFYNQIVGNFRQ